MSKSVPKIIRRDALLFRSGIVYRRMRKDRDNWEMIDEAGDREGVLYYEDVRPEPA